MPPGKYTYKATLERNESLKDQSFFVVQQSNSETEEREANHSLLKKWSNNSKGFFTTNADSLLLNIRNKVSVKSVLMTRNKSKSLLEFWPCLFFIVFCFSTEWFLRKYLGTY
jgi:putative lipoic acid-binding regulatory protein